MNRKIIIIEGYLASGKTTFAIQLLRAIDIPYLVKDTIKIALCTSVSLNNREESSRFSAITFDAMMYVTERLMETGYPVIIEGNFVPAGLKKVDEACFIKTLIDRYDYQSLTYKLMGDTQILYKRFIERDKSPERAQLQVPNYYTTFIVYDAKSIFEYYINPYITSRFDPDMV